MPSDSKHALIDGIKVSDADKKRLSVLAENGDAEAASTLAQHFFLVEQNYDLARYWFRKAAIHGDKHKKEVYQSFLESLK